MSDVLDKIVTNIKDPSKDQNRNALSQRLKTPLNYFDTDKFYTNMRKSQMEQAMEVTERDYIRASEAGDCSNLILFRLKGTEPDHNKVGRNQFLPLMAHVGNAIHSFLQKNYGFASTELPRNSDTYRIHCRVDALLDDDVIVEIKSVTDARILREKDIMQVTANYLVLKEHGYNIRAGQLVYVARSLTRIETYEIPLDDLIKYAHALVSKIDHIFECAVKKTETAKYLDFKQCVYCDYSNLCSKTKVGKKK